MQKESGINQTINLGVFQGDPFPDDNEFVPLQAMMWFGQACI